ncbi:MAG: DUF3871 family protein [Candidatus Cloacimonetes bacterium]|jgi:hypothetical protein|nr:DUF3871 family protein [Candidatus Cloacimonadota bacterium]
MELVRVNNDLQVYNPVVIENPIKNDDKTSDISFMSANTEPFSLEQLKSECIIPVFAKDNESTISHQEFIESVKYVAGNIFSGETILKPAIRVSHPIKGRIPEAMGKPAKDLLDHEKTLYYERMAFALEIPSIRGEVSGNRMNLTLGGVRAYNQENLYAKKVEEKFKIFIGFQVKVCTNLCVSTDGLLFEVRARTIAELAKAAYDLFGNYNVYSEVDDLNHFPEVMITEHQFAQMVGRAKMFHQLPFKEQKQLPLFPLSDSQVTQVVRGYYDDADFARNGFGEINLWQLLNLFTGANKSSYIDSFLDRSAMSTSFVKGLHKALRQRNNHWFLS